MAEANFDSRFFAWTPDDRPAVIFDIGAPADWDTIRANYSPGRDCPQLERIIEIAIEHGVQSVLCERRYIDIDYRSEHSRFYSTTFQRYPSVCHRLHFFTERVPEDVSDLAGLEPAYRGYSIMRPLPMAPVGRTMIAPPPSMAGAVVTLTSDAVNVLGTRLSVASVPFISQDAQFLVCAHASMWMVLHHAHLERQLPRRLPGEIHDLASGGVVVGRELPSEGISIHQILAALHQSQLSATRISLPETRQDNDGAGRLSLEAIIARYVNSQMPPIVTSRSHAWVVIGYALDEAPAGTSVRLFRHDDARGPFIQVDDPFTEGNDAHRPWAVVVPPLPEKAYITAEAAEALGRRWIQMSAVQGAAPQPIQDAHSQGELDFRTYAIDSRKYKERARGRLPGNVATLYRLAHLPHYLWIVEAVDKRLRRDGNPDVLGEVLIDSTAHQYAELESDAQIAMHLAGSVAITTPDHETLRTAVVPDFQPYTSGMPAQVI